MFFIQPKYMHQLYDRHRNTMRRLVMTARIVGRPRRTRPTDRVNYKLDTDVRKILRQISEFQGRNEGAQVEQLVLFWKAANDLNTEGETLTMGNIQARVNQLWAEMTAEDSADA